jgi:hypothetical protein
MLESVPFNLKMEEPVPSKTVISYVSMNLNGATSYICTRNLDTNRDKKQMNIFERKVYRRILGTVYENKKENWRILTNKEIHETVKKNPL